MSESYFEQLKSGLLIALFEQLAKEPANHVVNRISNKARFLQRRSEYAQDVSRVLEELRLTMSLMERLPGTLQLSEFQTREEDVLVYFQGIFFDLTHQLKDKLLQLVNLLTEDRIPDRPNNENDIRLSHLLGRKNEKLTAFGIKQLLQVWNQDSSSGIGVVLRKRVPYHHRVSSLRLKESFQRVKFAGLIQQSPFESFLSDEGKEELERLEKDSRERLKHDVLEKAKKTVQEIESNLDSISKALLTHMCLGVTEEKIKETLEAFTLMLKSLGIKNLASLGKVSRMLRVELDQATNRIETLFKDNLDALYLVGSLGRNEYVEGVSDINLYVVTVDANGSQHVNLDDKFNLLQFSKESFSSEEARKYRFICWADGVLIAGRDLVGAEQFPKPGLDLALLLNGDFTDEVNEWEKWIRDNRDATATQICKKSRVVAKRMIDFMYGVVMANKPNFTSSRNERIERINEMFPGRNTRVVGLLSRIVQHGVGTLDDLRNMIEGFRQKASENLEKMKAAQLQVLREDMEKKKR